MRILWILTALNARSLHSCGFCGHLSNLVLVLDRAVLGVGLRGIRLKTFFSLEYANRPVTFQRFWRGFLFFYLDIILNYTRLFFQRVGLVLVRFVFNGVLKRTQARSFGLEDIIRILVPNKGATSAMLLGRAWVTGQDWLMERCFPRFFGKLSQGSRYSRLKSLRRAWSAICSGGCSISGSLHIHF